MENIKPPVEDIIDNIKDYIETSSELYKHKATEKASEIVSNAIINLTIAFMSGFVLLFISIAAAFMISDFFNHSFAGFFIVAGIYAFMAIIIFLTRDKWLKPMLVNNFIKSIYSKAHAN